MKPTNPLWYLAAFLFALVSVMGATVVAAGGWTPVRESTVTPTSNEHAEAAGKSLAVFTDVLQPDRVVTCRGTGPGKKVIEIPGKGVDIIADSDGTRWHLIALLRDGSNGLRVRCTPRDRRPDNASYGFAAVTGYDSAVNNGKGVAVLGGTVGLGFAAYVYYCRRSRRKESADESA
ncbi:hypothetical protein [Aeromicrobium sp.]|uniref:hypothetical protein n=1 Tax=Aeromicrobium sp. TaxID=1871063 RepID=UPI001992587D|nr:hypothetical protein [Aeromicrobium sp.]MBC7631958.1 hypothetical protein [Aeromicrobium sp.]